MFKFPSSKLGLLLLAIASFSLASCGDDDDVLGIDTEDSGTVFLSSNTSGMVGILDVDDEDSPEIMTFMTEGSDADGIYYDNGQNNIFQVNRSNNTLIEYDNVFNGLEDQADIDIDSESEAVLTNGRGLAYNNEFFVVADDADATLNGGMNKLIAFDASEDETIDTLGTYPTTINLWGLRFIDDALYAVVDNSDSIAVFDDFLGNTPGDTVVPTRFIQVEGITRTHGLVYNETDDVMILTDVGSADSDTDGAIVIIRDFATLNNPATVAAGSYNVISGDATMLGNPVDVAYDEDNDMIYVAERANGGGRMLAFPLMSEGNVAPAMMKSFAGASSIFFYRD